jgi:bifunctional non-homologous end joining protein LigD
MSTQIRVVARPTAEDIFANTADKQLWPQTSLKDIMNYYIAVARYILPHIRDKVQSLRRDVQHEGAANEVITIPNAPWGEWVETVKIYASNVKEINDHLLCNNIETLLYLNTIGAIELHPWLSRYYIIDKPDSLVIDIAPTKTNRFEDVVTVATTVKEIVDSTGAKCYVKTSGAGGLHIYVPVNGQYEYDKVRKVAQVIAERTHERLPGITTIEKKSAVRPKDRIYIDYSHNKRGSTLPAVYSVRAGIEPYISMPLRWEEVSAGLQQEQFTIGNALQRIEAIGTDIFYPVLTDRTELNKVLNILN